MSNVAYHIEIPGVYDGWSIAVLEDGTLTNRWAGDDGKPLGDWCAWRCEVTERTIQNIREARGA